MEDRACEGYRSAVCGYCCGTRMDDQAEGVVRRLDLYMGTYNVQMGTECVMQLLMPSFFRDNTKLAILSLLGIEKYTGVVLAG